MTTGDTVLEWLHRNGFGPIEPWQEHIIRQSWPTPESNTTPNTGGKPMDQPEIEITLPVPPEATTNTAIHQIIGQTTQVKRHNGTHPWKATIRSVVHDRTAHTLTLRLAVDTPPPIDPQGWELAHPLQLPT